MPNPAMKLWEHFSELQEHAKAGQTNWPDAWAAVTGMPWERAAGPLLGLVDRSHRMLASQPDLHLSTLFLYETEWRQAILLPGVNPGAAMPQSGFLLSDAAVVGIYGVAIAIRGLPSTPELADEQIERLSHAVQSLREDVSAADEIEADLRLFLLDQVTAMQVRIDQRRVTGTGPIEDLVTETIGSAAVHASMWDRAMKSSLGTKVIAVFVALNAINGFINTTAQAVQSTEQAVQTVTTVVERVLGEPPRQIEAPNDESPPALPPGSSGSASSDGS